MSNNQNEAKLNASIEEIIRPLVKRLLLAKQKLPTMPKMETLIDQTISKVIKTKHSFHSIQRWEREVTGHFGKIERLIDSWIDHNDGMTEMNESTLKALLDNLSHEPSKEASDLPQKATICEVGEPSKRNDQEIELSKHRKELELNVHSSLGLYSLGIFPESAELRKSFLIYWWTGLGLLPCLSWENAKQYGEKIFSDLEEKGFLKCVHTKEHNQVRNVYTINPTIHKWLFSANEKTVVASYDESEYMILPFFGDWFNEKILINMDQGYLNPNEIIHKGNLQVVQLGNWRSTDTNVAKTEDGTRRKRTMSKDLNKVDDVDIFNLMGEKTTYLSLRGISRLQQVPESLGKLENLMILDLRACYNLKKLPQKPRSTLKQKLTRWKLPQQSWFNKLMVLDITDCYLLDHMPIWICELSNLEVLKGFVVGIVENNERSCRLGDLSKLNKLRKLTIRIVRDHLVAEDFIGLKPLHKLLVLTIIWIDNNSESVIPASSFPENLEKLDIRCYPKTEASEMLNPAELKNLKKLYIRGGKLTKIPCDENWEVEILRLKFLKNLDTAWEELKRSFMNLKCVEYVECPMLKNFPKDRSCWSKERDDNFQNANASVTSN